MPFQDSELDKLAAERDRAFRQVDTKRAAMDRASNDRKLLQNAYGYKLDYYKSRIPALKTEIDYAYEQSRSCYEARDGAGARSWSEQAKELREERSAAFEERNRMIEELKEANEQFQAALAEFREAKVEFEAARDAFTQRLNYLKEESARKRAEREAGARRRQQEQEAARQSREERKRKREANRQQFIDWTVSVFLLKTLEKYQDERQRQAREYTDGRGKTRRHQAQMQSRNEDCTVKVNYGYDHDHDVYTTDIYVFQHGINEHLHIVIDEDGNELFREWRPNH